MANTYTQIYVHIIFAVYDRLSLLKTEWQDELYKYIGGICVAKGHHPISINGMHDHVHLLVGIHPSSSISGLVQIIKLESSKWLKERFGIQKFAWQSGYAAFSYSKSQISAVKKYIENQKKHHSKVSFNEEIINILTQAGIEFDSKYLLKGFED